MPGIVKVFRRPPAVRPPRLGRRARRSSARHAWPPAPGSRPGRAPVKSAAMPPKITLTRAVPSRYRFAVSPTVWQVSGQVPRSGLLVCPQRIDHRAVWDGAAAAFVGNPSKRALEALEIGDFPPHASKMIDRQVENFAAGVDIGVDQGEQAAQLVDAEAQFPPAQDEAQAALIVDLVEPVSARRAGRRYI